MLGFIALMVGMFLLGKNEEKIKEFIGEILTDDDKDKE